MSTPSTSQKRTMSSWEVTFSHWSTPPSKTEKEKCENAESMIRNAIQASDELQSRDIDVFAQGSYKNRTNITSESDVDICIRCNESQYFDLPSDMTAGDFNISTPAEYTFNTFKNEVGDALNSYFGSTAVERGNKAFEIHENTYHVAADVVPAFGYSRYFGTGSRRRGISIIPDNGARIVNYPKQHYDNGVDKHEQTTKRFKKIVRILKNLKSEMLDSGHTELEKLPSFLIESLVWNVDNGGFGHLKLTNDVRYVLAHIYNETRRSDSCEKWFEVNGIKYLFHNSQPWNLADVNHGLNCMWNYIGFD